MNPVTDNPMAPPSLGHDLARFHRLMLKEMRETLRDRRTILTLLGMPLLVYPLLGLVFQKFLVTQASVLRPPEYHLAFATAEEAEAFRGLMRQASQHVAAHPPPEPSVVEPILRLMVVQEGHPLETVIAEREADLGLRLRRQPEGGWSAEFVQLRADPAPLAARQYVEQRLRTMNDAFVADLLRQQEPPLRLPFEWTARFVTGRAAPAFSLASLVPLILLLMTITGAVYPAIDLTAGERERGTLETLMAAPVPRYQILCAKYAAVMLVVLLTAVANIAAMTATSFATGLDRTLFGEEGASWDLWGKLLALLTVFASFFAAVMLTFTSVARSFKEAQAYLIPLMLASLAPGVLALFPGLEMNVLWAVTPLANIVLLARELFDHRVQPLLAGLTLLSTLGYAGMALSAAARLFGTDAVLYGSTATWSDLWRRPRTRRAVPDLTLGVVALGGLLPAFVLLSGWAARVESWTGIDRLAANAGVLLLLFAVWPAGLAWLRRIEFRGAFRLETPSPWALAGAVCLGVSLWPFVYELVRFTSPARLTELAERFGELAREVRETPWIWRLLTLAVVPAVCEEWFFRGFLFQALRTKAGPWGTVALTAALFGLFHTLLGDTLLAVRFVPATLMGLVLGALSLRTGSLFPGMVVHVLHNSALLTLEQWFPQLGFDEPPGASGEGLGRPVLLVAAAIAALGVMLVLRARPRLISTLQPAAPPTDQPL
uniref:CPBP family intramembrane metalloprotease n=1 Tax=Schlesneria paludicola TaxID=360056 RepID=A0A7C4QNE6_9PLAN